MTWVMTVDPLAWLLLFGSLVVVAVIGLCQLSRVEARRRREELTLRKRYGKGA